MRLPALLSLNVTAPSFTGAGRQADGPLTSPSMRSFAGVRAALGLTVLALAALVSSARAQTFVGNLNGTSSESTIQDMSGTLSSTVGAVGWSAFAGGAQFFNVTPNHMILGTGPYDSYGVQYTFGAATLAANSVYTLNFRMGYVSADRTPVGSYTMTLGTWNGGTSTFTPFTPVTGSASTSGNVNQSILFFGSAQVTYGSADSNNSVTQSISFTTGATVPGEVIAVRWSASNPGVDPVNSDYLGLDNVALSVSAIPEPSTYAAILGAAALGAAYWRRRRTA